MTTHPDPARADEPTDATPEDRHGGDERDLPRSAPMPDAEDAPRAEDLIPDEPPANAPMIGDPAKKTAIDAPVPAHGLSASPEQRAEGERAEELADRRERDDVEDRRDR